MLSWTEKHQGERRERHLGEQMPSVIYEVRPKQCHNSLKEAAGMKSKDDFLRGEKNSLGKDCFHHLCVNEFG